MKSLFKNDPNKPKPPVAAQILYALGILGLIFGLLSVVILVGSTNDDAASSVLSAFGVSKVSIYAEALLTAALIIGGFALINAIRSGKKWALISYTTIIGLAFFLTLYETLTASPIEKYLNGGSNNTMIVSTGLVGALVAVLWTRNRDYFK